MTMVFLALGSNLGDRKTNLYTAIDFLRRKMTIRRVSSIYETEPAYVTDQPPFLNLVLQGETDLKPMELLRLAKSIEHDMGRKKTIRFGPRVVDVDILLYGDEHISAPLLTVPHPRMTERAFVLIPLAEIAPDVVIPGTEKPVALLVAQLPDGGLGKILDPDNAD